MSVDGKPLTHVVAGYRSAVEGGIIVDIVSAEFYGGKLTGTLSTFDSFENPKGQRANCEAWSRWRMPTWRALSAGGTEPKDSPAGSMPPVHFTAGFDEPQTFRSFGAMAIRKARSGNCPAFWRC